MGPEIILASAAPMIKSLVEKLVTPKLENFAKQFCDDFEDLMISKAEPFQEYLNRMYEKLSVINTLVFHNSQRQIKDIYIAQSLVKFVYFNDKEITKIDYFPVSLMKKYKKILIQDTAGMGKSTIMKHMFVELIDEGLEDVGIPIYIELNRLNKNRNILSVILEEISSLSEVFDKVRLLKFIQTGGFIFFLDGFDEISPVDKDEVIVDVQSFISKAGTNNYFVLTSRPEDRLSSFGDFQSFYIQKLARSEAYELLNKYDLSKNKTVSVKLVELLKSGDYPSIDEFLDNPLLVSLLFTAYDYNRSIPFEKHRFYGIVFDAYFEKHDYSKPLKSRVKYSGLNQDGFNRILRYLGYDCLFRIGVQFSEITILESIGKAKAFCGNLVFSDSLFLKDLVETVPLFCRDGTDYKWIHKSLLEYFAANFIFCNAKQNQDKILSAIYNSSQFMKYSNMLDIYFDIDYKGFSKNITLKFCEDYIHFYNVNFCESKKISKQLIENRIEILFVRDCALMITDLNKEYERYIQFTKVGDFVPTDFYKECAQYRNENNTSLYIAWKNVKYAYIIGFLFKKTRFLFNLMNRMPIPDRSIERFKGFIINNAYKKKELY